MQTPETMSSEAALADATALIYREHEHLRQGVAFEQLAGLIAPLEPGRCCGRASGSTKK